VGWSEAGNTPFFSMDGELPEVGPLWPAVPLRIGGQQRQKANPETELALAR